MIQMVVFPWNWNILQAILMKELSHLRNMFESYADSVNNNPFFGGSQVIRVKWSLHAQEKIVFELLQQLRGNAARVLLEGVMKSTRQMFAEQEAVRSRLFIIQDVMQSSVQARLQILQNLNYFF
ncbi:hypothetical protein AAZX31_15G183300 [Glycine max]